MHIIGADRGKIRVGGEEMKKLVPFLLIMTVSVYSLPFMENRQVKVINREVKYVALGDSIAAGFGLKGFKKEKGSKPPAESYQAIVAKSLRSESVNQTVSGQKSKGLLKRLLKGEMDEALDGADYITLSIGSNDLLKPFQDAIFKELGMKKDNTADALKKVSGQFKNMGLKEIIKFIQNVQKSMANNPELNEAIGSFYGNFREIIRLIREKAPNARIYVTNAYNPYYGIVIPIVAFDLSSLTASYIMKLNQVFEEKNPEFTLVDVYTAFNTRGLTQARLSVTSLSSINMDPHPNEKGHRLIAELIGEAMRIYIKPEAVKIMYLFECGKEKNKTEKNTCPDA